MSTATAQRIIGHQWTLLPRKAGWRLAIQGDDGTTGTLRIAFNTNNHVGTVTTDAGARALLHLVPAAELVGHLTNPR